MESNFDEVIARLESDISFNEQENDILKRLAKNIQRVKLAMEEVIAGAEFWIEFALNDGAQILYNKHRFPRLVSKLLFFRKYSFMENCRLHWKEQEWKSFCEKELDEMHAFYLANREFYDYYYSENTDDDWRLFTSLNGDDPPRVPTEISEYPFNNPGCLLTAALEGYKLYARMVQRELSGGQGDTKRNIRFSFLDIDLVEQVLAQHAAGTTEVDGKPATQEFLIEEARKYYNRPLKNWEQVASNARRRGEGIEHHLRLINALRNRNELLLEGKRPKRRLNTRKK